MSRKLSSLGPNNTNFTIDIEREEDGRFIAEVMELPGVMVYGETRHQATRKAKALAFRVMADYIESGKIKTTSPSLSFNFV